MDLIERQAVIDALYDWSEHSMTDAEAWHIRQVIGDIKSLPPAEPNCSEIPNNSDCISRQAAITAIQKAYADTEGGTDKCAVWKNVGLTNALHIMQDLPSAQPEITGEQAIEHLQSTGWMQNHDREMYDMGLKKQLADDSGSYDSLFPSAQPDIIRCKDCKHRPFDSEDTQGFGVEFPDEKCPCQCDDGWYNWRPNDEWFCANAERRTDETD